MEKFRKYIALALMLAFAITMVGCGDTGEQEETAETGASETIGAGMDANTELDVSETDAGMEIGEEKKPKDFMFILPWITSMEEDKTEITLSVAHHLKESKSVEFSYQDVLLDGVAVENWKVQGQGGETSFTTEPDMLIWQIFDLNVNIEDYSELTVHATANFDDGTEPYPFSATFQISEMERRIEEKAEIPTSDSDDALAAGMAAYREIVTHADTYDYTYEEAYLDPGSRNGVYHYALVFAGSDDVPALLLKQDGDTGFNIVKVFQYASGWGDIYEAGTLAEGVDNLGFHRSLYIPTDKPSIIYNESYGDNKGGETRRYTITGAGSSESNLHLGLQYGLLWSSINSGSNVDTSLEETGRVEIEWYDITDMTGLDNGRPSEE